MREDNKFKVALQSNEDYLHKATSAFFFPCIFLRSNHNAQHRIHHILSKLDLHLNIQYHYSVQMHYTSYIHHEYQCQCNKGNSGQYKKYKLFWLVSSLSTAKERKWVTEFSFTKNMTNLRSSCQNLGIKNQKMLITA